MKLTFAQLSKSLPLLPIYFIHGDETLLCQEARSTILAQLRSQGYQSQQRYFVDTGFNWQDLLAQTTALDLFSEKTLIEISLNSGSIGKAGSESIQTILNHFPDDKVLLLTAPKLENSVTTSKWYKLIEQVGAVLPIWPIKLEEFPAWLQQRCQQANLTLELAAITLLSQYTEGNLLAAKQEIEKLSLLFPEGEISSQQVMQAISDHARYDVFALVDAWLAQDTSRYQRILDHLQQEAVEPILILWGLNRECRTLAKIAYAYQQGTTLANACQQYGVWQNRQALVQRHVKQHTLEDYYHWLKIAAQIDKTLKGVISGNVWQQLSLFNVNLDKIIR